MVLLQTRRRRRSPLNPIVSTPSPDDASPLADLLDDASGCVATGDLDGAAALFRDATNLDPACFDAWHGLGMMATDLRPNDLLAWTALSQVHVKMGNIAEAEAAKGNARILSLGGRIKRD